MESMKTTEQINNPAERGEKSGWRLRLLGKLSVAATALLSLLGSVEANSPSDKGPLKTFFGSTSTVPDVSNTEFNLGM